MKLNQVIAIEKSIRSSSSKKLTKEYHDFQRLDIFTGVRKTYTPETEGEEVLPPSYTKVKKTTSESIDSISSALEELINVTGDKDRGNLRAVADVVVNGSTVLSDVPVTNLLFLEKQLQDLNTALEALPVLDPSYDWTFDEGEGLYKSSEVKSNRTKKVNKPIVLYPPTDKHPAQTQLVVEDVVTGEWITRYLSGAMPLTAKNKLIGHLQKLRIAVKMARETANSVDVEKTNFGTDLVKWLFD